MNNKKLAALVLALSALFLSACSVVINPPADQSTVAATAVPVNIGLPWLYKAGTFKATLNEADITSQFTVDAQAGTARATLTLQPGSYVLDASACWGINILFVQAPPFPLNGCSSARSGFTVVQPHLVLGPSGLALNVGQSGTATVQAIPAPGASLTVTLAAGPALGVPAGVTLPANSAAAQNISVQGASPGSATLSASAVGYTATSLAVAVKPLLSQLSPASGPPGTAVAVTGAGFVAPVSVKFGTAASISVTPASGTQLSVTVPQLAAGTVPVTVTSNGQTSAPLNFAVTAAPPSNVTTLFRATNDRVEMIQFTLGSPFSASTFGLLANPTTFTSPGMLSVGLCRDGSRLAWAGSANVKLFAIGGTAAAPTLTPGFATPLPSALTGVGTACAFLPTVLVRGTDTGVDNLDPATNPLAKLGGFSGGLSSTGVALIASSPRVWRSHSTGLEQYDMTTPASPVRSFNVITNMSASTTGTALAWLVPGATLVRATNAGIDVVSVSATAAPSRLGFNNTGGSSSVGVGVSVVGTRAIRATDFGIEVYDVSTPSAPVRCLFRNAGLSSTGVGVVAVGTLAFRVTNVGIEAYDISNTTCPNPPSGTLIPAPVQLQTGLGTTTTGVAVVGP
jgi:IPT/TIG domain-containing protein